jgi:serine O-acetyltransferase
MNFLEEIKEDIDVVVKKDPAARNRLEVLLCYPGVWALIWHKPAHWLYNHNFKLIARMLSQHIRNTTGVEIHPGAKIGRRCMIDHGMGIVIGETTEIGDDCLLYQGVTLGGTGKDVGKRHPTLGNRVIVSSGAKVLGPFKVGDDVKIGAGSVVLKEVPSGCTVVGVPGHVVRRYGESTDEVNQVNLPDPINVEMECLRRRIETMEKKLDYVTKKLEEAQKELAEARGEEAEKPEVVEKKTASDRG